MNTGLAIKRQLLIFGLYLFFASLFLLNHKGGANIIFMMLMVFSFLLHVVVTVIKILRAKQENQKKWTIADLLVLIAILVLFFLMLPHYMDFMWQLTK